jgi:hypothetical protein
MAAGKDLSAPGLDYVIALYRQAGSEHVSPTHGRLRTAAHRIASGVEAHQAAGAPTGYLESARRIGSARQLAVQAKDFSRETAELLGDTSLLLPVANEGLALLKAYAEACESDDETLRDTLHAAQQQRRKG